MTIANGYVTLPVFKDYLFPAGNAGDDQNSQMEAAIEAASREIDRYCGRRFYLDGSATARYYQPEGLRCVKTDDIATTSGLVVQIDTSNDGTYGTTVGASAYLALPVNRESGGIAGLPWREIQLLNAGGYYFPSGTERPPAKITAVWGWAAVPTPIVTACKIKAARLFRRAMTPEGIAAGESFGAIRITQYEDPDVTMLLGPYRRAGYGSGLVVA